MDRGREAKPVLNEPAGQGQPSLVDQQARRIAELSARADWLERERERLESALALPNHPASSPSVVLERKLAAASKQAEARDRKLAAVEAALETESGARARLSDRERELASSYARLESELATLRAEAERLKKERDDAVLARAAANEAREMALRERDETVLRIESEEAQSNADAATSALELTEARMFAESEATRANAATAALGELRERLAALESRLAERVETAGRAGIESARAETERVKAELSASTENARKELAARQEALDRLAPSLEKAKEGLARAQEELVMSRAREREMARSLEEERGRSRELDLVRARSAELVAQLEVRTRESVARTDELEKAQARASELEKALEAARSETGSRGRDLEGRERELLVSSDRARSVQVELDAKEKECARLAALLAAREVELTSARQEATELACEVSQLGHRMAELGIAAEAPEDEDTETVHVALTKDGRVEGKLAEGRVAENPGAPAEGTPGKARPPGARAATGRHALLSRGMGAAGSDRMVVGSRRATPRPLERPDGLSPPTPPEGVPSLPSTEGLLERPSRAPARPDSARLRTLSLSEPEEAATPETPTGKWRRMIQAIKSVTGIGRRGDPTSMANDDTARVDMLRSAIPSFPGIPAPSSYDVVPLPGTSVYRGISREQLAQDWVPFKEGGPKRSAAELTSMGLLLALDTTGAGTDSLLVSGIRSRRTFAQKEGLRIRTKLDWRGTEDTRYLSAGIFLTTDPTTRPLGELDPAIWLDIVGVPPGRAARLYAAFRENQAEHPIYNERWLESRDGNPLELVWLEVELGSKGILLRVNGRGIAQSPGKLSGPITVVVYVRSPAEQPERSVVIAGLEIG